MKSPNSTSSVVASIVLLIPASLPLRPTLIHARLRVGEELPLPRLGCIRVGTVDDLRVEVRVITVECRFRQVPVLTLSHCRPFASYALLGCLRRSAVGCYHCCRTEPSATCGP